MASISVSSPNPPLFRLVMPKQEFESALKEVVHAKRLSASKMNNLTEIALRSMQDDTQLVSILYRTHKSLQPPAKVSSLYVFDALARAARTQVVKHNLTGDINSRKGNCATFLLKVEGVLEGLFQDMISAATPESKEKTKKVLDIWSKGSTFPPAILVRLKDVMSETGKGAYHSQHVFAKYSCNSTKFFRVLLFFEL
ncbi:hypothetical protein C8R44DRAFT_67078 [Mycena epipterygia]|nr:hypothetical protein C8R44DRAFT_67078 [Mycena epipterygia]